MSARPRRAFTLFQLLTLLAILALGFALFLPGLAKARMAAARVQSQNNLKQIGIAALNYYDANNVFPPGCDAENFSAATYLLPYVEQANVYNMIDLKKPVDDKANAAVRMLRIKVFLNPLDPVMQVKPNYGPTNYLFNAGSKPDLKDNDGLFYLDSKVKLPDIADGASQTLLAAETLKGDGDEKPEAPTVRRQHVLLKKDALKGIKDDAGVSYFKEKQDLAFRPLRQLDGRSVLAGNVQHTAEAQRPPARRELRRRRRRLVDADGPDRRQRRHVRRQRALHQHEHQHRNLARHLHTERRRDGRLGLLIRGEGR